MTGTTNIAATVPSDGRISETLEWKRGEKARRYSNARQVFWQELGKSEA
jgi:hypothetical protein